MDEKDVIIPEAAPAPLSEEDIIRRDAWAQFRLGLISSVVFNTHDKRSERQELIRISCRYYKGPDGTMVKCSYQTLCRWVRSYRDKGIAGLYTKKRSDSGSTRVLSLEVQVRIQEILKAVPSIRIAKLGRRLVEEGLLNPPLVPCQGDRIPLGERFAVLHQDQKEGKAALGVHPGDHRRSFQADRGRTMLLAR